MNIRVVLYIDVDTGGERPFRTFPFVEEVPETLAPMAAAAGVYHWVWDPESRKDSPKARDLIEPLALGIAQMKLEPAKFIAMNPEDTRGEYLTFLAWLERYLRECIKHPKTSVAVSR